jgi:hypothetical protein
VRAYTHREAETLIQFLHLILIYSNWKEKRKQGQKEEKYSKGQDNVLPI